LIFERRSFAALFFHFALVLFFFLPYNKKKHTGGA